MTVSPSTEPSTPPDITPIPSQLTYTVVLNGVPDSTLIAEAIALQDAFYTDSFRNNTILSVDFVSYESEFTSVKLVTSEV